MLFDYSQLINRIVDTGKTFQDIASAAGISKDTLISKLMNKEEFSQDEMRSVCDFLNIPPSDIAACFFTEISGNKKEATGEQLIEKIKGMTAEQLQQFASRADEIIRSI